MTTIQLHVEAVVAGVHRVRVFHYPEEALPGTEQYVGVLDLPPWLVQQLDQLTPFLASVIGSECRIVWTGALPPALPPDPVMAKAGKVLRALRRVFGNAAA